MIEKVYLVRGILDFVDTPSLSPVYDVCDSFERAQKVKDELRKRFSERDDLKWYSLDICAYPINSFIL